MVTCPGTAGNSILPCQPEQTGSSRFSTEKRDALFCYFRAQQDKIERPAPVATNRELGSHNLW
jgi:hypothetical protein